MTPKEYFSSGVIGIVAGVAAAGIPTIATTWNRRQPGQRPKEPGYSVGLILTYLPVAYLLGGVLAVLVRSSNAAVNAMLVGVSAAIGHIAYLRQGRSVEEPAGRFAGTGISSFYAPGKHGMLGDALRADLRSLPRARLVVPNVREFLHGGSAFGAELRNALVCGLRLEVLSDGVTTEVDDIGMAVSPGRVDIVGSDSAEATGHWLILQLGSVVYFGLWPEHSKIDALPIYRGSLSGTPGIAQVADAVCEISSILFERSRNGEALSKVVTSSSPRAYRQRIVPAEAGAGTIDRIPKRLSVLFKGEKTVQTIAEQRFGRGSPSVAVYVEEHEERRREFFGALGRGMRCREIYNELELISYVSSGAHSASVRLPRGHLVDTVARWRQAVEIHSNYLVAITNDPLPFKYELIDGRLVVLHEAIGVSDSHRLNAIFVEGHEVGKAFFSDFETIWERVAPERRGKSSLLEYIDRVLMPLALKSGGTDDGI